MATRPAGINAFTRAFKSFPLDIERLRAFDRPVLYTIGGRSNPVAVRLPPERLGQIFPDFTLEVFEERHHFDPPHRVEPERLRALAAQTLGSGARCIKVGARPPRFRVNHRKTTSPPSAACPSMIRSMQRICRANSDCCKASPCAPLIFRSNPVRESNLCTIGTKYAGMTGPLL